MQVDQFFFIESLGTLYTDIQSGNLFSDSKFFVDCIPRYEPTQIVAAYETEKHKDGFNLKAFIEKNFILPQGNATDYQSGKKPITKHLEDLWDVLRRTPDGKGGTLIPLPFPYIVPGGRFREVYYWDSYFTMLGLQVSRRIDVMQNMIDNFAYLIDLLGFIPNGNRTYYLGRSQPPFFSLMVELLALEKGEETIEKYRQQLEKEYAFWMEGERNLSASQTSHRRVVKMPDGTVLNRYWDDNDTPRPEAYHEDVALAKKSTGQATEIYRNIRAAAESGWDFSSRWFKDGQRMETIHTTDLIPVDLNCLLLHLEEVLLKLYSKNEETVLSSFMEEKIKDRKQGIQKFCFILDKGYYFDYNHTEHSPTGWYSLSAVYPLFFSVASPDQANLVARIVEQKFLQPGGVVTTTYATGQQWDDPNGWAPLQWMAYKGLLNYGHLALAQKIRNRWIKNNEKVYDATGKMMEKYNVVDISDKAGGGEYPNQDGFGWTNGIYLKFLSEF